MRTGRSTRLAVAAALLLGLLGLAGCSAGGPAWSGGGAPPSSCVDQFSGRVVRSCL